MKLLNRGEFLAFLSLTAMIACGGGGAGSVVDTVAPTATSVPSVRPVSENATITITFSESMDTTAGTLQLSGDLASESDGGVWSMTTEQNDTLTINPASTWFGSPERTLTIDALDLAGNALSSLTLTYDVYRGVLYFVDGSKGDDNNDGLTPAKARKSIHSAVSTVSTGFLPATILVHEGAYDSVTQIVLKGNFSLYGGYSQNFTLHDPATYTTTIEDKNPTSFSPANPNRVIEGDGSITSSAVIDGFTIQGSKTTNYTAAVVLDNNAAPTLQNNTINGGSGITSYGMLITSSSPTVFNNIIKGGSGDTSYGMRNIGSSPTVFNNIIKGGSGGRFSLGMSNSNSSTSSPTVYNNTINGGSGSISSHGIYNSGSSSSSFAVYNNTIDGGSGSTSYGMRNIGSSPTVYNNTINGGSGNTSFGMDNNNSSPAIDNNIIFTNTNTVLSYCIHESSSVGLSKSPSSLHNNNLFQCEKIYVDSQSGCSGNACTLVEINALTGVSGNISVDPVFVSGNDWHFSAATPASVKEGGLNGIDQVPAWTFTTDKDDVTRPGSSFPWSIGAYEP